MVQAEHLDEQRKVGHHKIDSENKRLPLLTKNGRCERKDWKGKTKSEHRICWVGNWM